MLLGFTPYVAMSSYSLIVLPRSLTCEIGKQQENEEKDREVSLKVGVFGRGARGWIEQFDNYPFYP